MAAEHTSAGLLQRAITVPWHVVLLPVAVLIAFWQDAGVQLGAAVRPLAFTLGTSSFVLLMALTSRRADRAAALFSLLVIVAWSKNILTPAIELALLMDPGQQALLLLLTGSGAVVGFRIAAGLGLAAWRSPHLTSRANGFAAMLLLATIVTSLVGGRGETPLAEPASNSDIEQAGSSTAEVRRDIYVILLDGYARADVLEARFGFDNGSFLGELAARDFVIAERATTPYLWTRSVLTAMFHMAYLEDIPGMRPLLDGPASLDRLRVDALNENRVFELLSDAGYRSRAVSPGFEHVALRQADDFVDSGAMTDFELRLLDSTFLGDIGRAVQPDLAASQLRSRILHSCDIATSPVTEQAGATFSFIHLPAPHGPFVFGPRGEARQVVADDDFFRYADGGEPDAVEEYSRAYLGELQFTNALALACVDQIRSTAARPPVIVIFSDHGPSSRVSWMETDPAEAAPADLIERTAVLTAAYTPARTDVFPDDVITVDIFRHLFDAYFGTEFGRASPTVGGRHIEPLEPSGLNESQ